MLAIAASCTKEETSLSNKEYNHDAPVFKASMSTKAELSGTKVNWVADDHIAVWNGEAKADYSTTGSGATADFTTSDSFASASEYVALYPFSAGASCTSGTVSTELPAAQTATAAGFDPAAHLAVATATSTTLSFKNAVAYLRFTVPTGMDDLTSVSFSGNNSEKVAGACTINASTGALTATGSATATLSGTFTEGTEYYIAVAPQEYASGYTVTITRTSATYSMVSDKDITFVRSEARNIGELWDAKYALEGSSITTVRAMKVITGTTQHDEVYSFRGPLRAGSLSVRKLSDGSFIKENVTISADGNYHVMYNATTTTLKVYSQDILVDFINGGSNSVGTTSAPWNMITAAGTDKLVADYFGDNTDGIYVNVGSSAVNNGTGGDDKNGPTVYIDDDEILRGAWYDSLQLDATGQSSDSVPLSINITNLDPEAVYDLRLVAMRFNATPSARVTKFTVIGKVTSSPQTVNQGYARGDGWTSFAAWDFRTNNIRDFEAIQPDGSGNIEIQVVGVNVSGRTGYNFNAFRISKVVYSQN